MLCAFGYFLAFFGFLVSRFWDAFPFAIVRIKNATSPVYHTVNGSAGNLSNKKKSGPTWDRLNTTWSLSENEPRVYQQSERIIQ